MVLNYCNISKRFDIDCFWSSVNFWSADPGQYMCRIPTDMEIWEMFHKLINKVLYFSAYFGPASVPVTIPSSGVQRNSISSLSQSPSSPLGSLPHSTFTPHLHQNKQDQQIEQVRNVSCNVYVVSRYYVGYKLWTIIVYRIIVLQMIIILVYCWLI